MRGPSRFWSYLYRVGVARAHMPFWRVVVEAEADRRARPWPSRFDSAVAAVFVWARTIEEAEGLASLALAEEGLQTVTADAVKCAPCARPSRTPRAVARTTLAFLPADYDEEADPASRWDARA